MRGFATAFFSQQLDGNTWLSKKPRGRFGGRNRDVYPFLMGELAEGVPTQIEGVIGVRHRESVR